MRKEKRKILGVTPANWYKSLHVFLACSWFGAVLSVILIYLVTTRETLPQTILSNCQLIEWIDKCVIIPSSVGCFVFGLVISWQTNWGFLKYKWIVVKLIVGSALILFGIFFLGPWIMQSADAPISELDAYTALQDKLGISMMVQAFVIGVTIFISTIKPWGKMPQKK